MRILFFCPDVRFPSSLGGLDPLLDGSYGGMDLDLGLSIKAPGFSIGYTSDKAMVYHVGKPYKTDKNGDRDPVLFQTSERLLEEKWRKLIYELKREVVSSKRVFEINEHKSAAY